MSETDTAVKARAPGKRRTAAELDALAADLEAREAAVEAREEELTSPETPQKQPVRSRATSERRARRARGKNDLSHRMKLGVGFDLDPDMKYRWINGGLDNQRLHDLTQVDAEGGDWMPVSKTGEMVDEKSDSTGTVLRRAVGVNAAGEVEYSYLCAKPKDLYEQDRQYLQDLNDKRIQAITRGGSMPGMKPGDSTTFEGSYGYEAKLGGQATKAIKI